MGMSIANFLCNHFKAKPELEVQTFDGIINTKKLDDWLWNWKIILDIKEFLNHKCGLLQRRN
jgi:hypothetical protein